MSEQIQISPIARAYIAAVRAGQVTEDSPERQLQDAAQYILIYGVDGCTADVLRVVAALCEAVAELKETEAAKPSDVTATYGMSEPHGQTATPTRSEPGDETATYLRSEPLMETATRRASDLTVWAI